MKVRAWGVVVLGLFVLMAASVSGTPVTAQQGSEQGSIPAEFESAAREYGVAVEILLAMGYVNTRWEMPAGESRDGGWGVMHLVQNRSTDTLSEASRLTGASIEQLQTDRYQNIRGGAALLARAQGSNRSDSLNDWYAAVKESGGGTIYANQVYTTLQSGATATVASGETVTLAAQSGASPQEVLSSDGSANYPGATWYPAYSGNYTADSRPTSHRIHQIVIHMTQSSYASALNWFQDPASGVSAHYTVRSSDGAVAQSVSDMNIAHHAGNWDYNQTSIGIEHEGWVEDPKWFTEEMYQSSARLAGFLARKYDIPVDRNHIVGHNEIPGADHTDPGYYWDWDKYISYVKQYAGDTGSGGGSVGGGTGYSQTIDNVDQTTSRRFQASDNWRWSRYSSERYYWNYRFTTPKATSDAARYRFDIPADGTYAVYAWWPSNPAYNTATPIGIKTSAGWRWITVNQTHNGGRWVNLGTFNMTAGDETKVQVSRWTAGKGYVIADAMKVVRQ